MKVIKAEDVSTEAQVENPTPNADPVRLAEAQEKFDQFRQMLETKNYDIALTADQTTALFDVFYSKVAWKGYESYAIAETFDKLNALVVDHTLVGKTSVEIVEAIFHFLKNHIGTGVEEAKAHKQLCDQFAIPMKEINEDRQELRDRSLEVVAAEQGITVENLVEEYQKAQALQGQR